MQEGVIIQNIRDFTIQVRSIVSNMIVGTGFIVSKNGDIATCTHVIKQAIANTEKLDHIKIPVYLPQLADEGKRLQYAIISNELADYEDDVIILKILNKEIEFPNSQVAILGDADKSTDNKFRSYGYRRLEKYQSGRAIGVILGSIEAPEGFNLLVEPVELQSEGIDSGMSGSAVLDTDRNLVVGIVSETWNPGSAVKNQNTAWAVNAKVLTFKPFNLQINENPYPKYTAPNPKATISLQADSLQEGQDFLYGAPAPLSEWIGRAELLDIIDSNYLSKDIKVNMLVGFGGQGKTSVARRWLDNFLNTQHSESVKVFWWTFYNSPSIDLFFETALKFVTINTLDTTFLIGNTVKAQVLASILKQREFIFVLDGIEVIQHQEGDDYGLLMDQSIKDFFSFISGYDSKTFCLITTRIPLFDLLMFTSCASIEINQFKKQEAINLLKHLDIAGSDEQLLKIYEECSGHPLTISLLAGYIQERFNGDAGKFDVFNLSDKAHYKRVNDILDEYETILNQNEIFIITLFSIFRRSVPEDLFEIILSWEFTDNVLVSEVIRKGINTYEQGIKKLISLRIVRMNEYKSYLQVHPLIKKHFLEQAIRNKKYKLMSAIARDVYISLSTNIQDSPSLEQLFPLIEAVYHSCQAGKYDEGMNLYLDRIDQKKGYILFQCGGYDTALSLFKNFFPNEDLSSIPNLTSQYQIAYIFRALGVCLMTVGKLEDADILLTKSTEFSIKNNLIEDAAKASQVKCELFIYTGLLNKSIDCANLTIEIYESLSEVEYISIDLDNVSWGVQNLYLGVPVQKACTLAYLAWAYLLKGDLNKADIFFELSLHALKAADPKITYLRDLWGIYYGDYLRISKKYFLAEAVINENLEYGLRNKIPEIVSQSNRSLGDLYYAIGSKPSAKKHYDSAVHEARFISHSASLIEGLLARGSFYVNVSELETAKRDLNEALLYSKQSNFKLYEIDIRIAIAKSLLVVKNYAVFQKEIAIVESMAELAQYNSAIYKCKELMSIPN